MRVKLTSVPVSDVEAARRFYVETLGFVVKRDEPMGETRLVTRVAPDEPDGAQLMLEPCGEHPATKAFKTAIYEEGIPIAAFEVDDVAADHERLTAKGVAFRGEPADMGGERVAVFDDTCGNLIMIYEVKPR